MINAFNTVMKLKTLLSLVSLMSVLCG